MIFRVLQCKTFKPETVPPVPKSNTSSVLFRHITETRSKTGLRAWCILTTGIWVTPGSAWYKQRTV